MVKYVTMLEYGERKEAKLNQIKDVQGIELMAGDKVAFFEVPRTKKIGKPYMVIGKIQRIFDHDDPLRNLTVKRDDGVIRYRLCGNLALIPDENEEEEEGKKDGTGKQSGSGEGEQDENPKDQNPGSQGGEAQEEDGPDENPFGDGSGTPQKKESQEQGEASTPGKRKKGRTLGSQTQGQKDQDMFDTLLKKKLAEERAFKKQRQAAEQARIQDEAMRALFDPPPPEDDYDIPDEPSSGGDRSHFGVEYDMKTGETRRTKCECPQCK